MTSASVAHGQVEGAESIVLSAGDHTATFLPEVGMLGASLTYRGEEYLSRHGGVDAYRQGHTTGLPLLYPWANRLERFGYSFGGVDVEFADEPPIHAMKGLPIHGTMTAVEGWEVVSAVADGDAAALETRFRFGDHPAQLRSFPFPHELMLSVALTAAGLRVTATVAADRDVAVPVSFGWHPYFVLSGVDRAEVSVILPARDHVDLDDEMLPTGATTHEPAAAFFLGDGPGETTFDDAYRLPDDPADRVLAIEGDGRRLEIDFDAGYPYAQVYAPSGHPFVALEPMTAPINALVSGDHPVVGAGDAMSATFEIRVTHVIP